MSDVSVSEVRVEEAHTIVADAVTAVDQAISVGIASHSMSNAIGNPGNRAALRVDLEGAVGGILSLLDQHRVLADEAVARLGAVATSFPELDVEMQERA